MEKLLNKTEVCELLGISRPTLDRIVAAGEIETLRIGGSVRFETGALQSYLARCREPRQQKKTAQAAPIRKGRPGRPKGSRKAADDYYYPGMRVV